MKFLVLLLLSMAPSRSQASRKPDANVSTRDIATCSIRIHGRNNTVGTLACVDIDVDLAKQFSEMVETTKHSDRLLSSVVLQMRAIVQQVRNGSLPSTAPKIGGSNSPLVVGNATVTGGAQTGSARDLKIHKAPVFTAAQQAALSEELKPYSGRRVVMQVQRPTQAADAFATALAESMKAAGLSVLVYRSMGGDPITPPGISAAAGEQEKPVFSTIEKFLKNNGLIENPIPFSASTPPNLLWITIAPW